MGITASSAVTTDSLTAGFFDSATCCREDGDIVTPRPLLFQRAPHKNSLASCTTPELTKQRLLLRTRPPIQVIRTTGSDAFGQTLDGEPGDANGSVMSGSLGSCSSDASDTTCSTKPTLSPVSSSNDLMQMMTQQKAIGDAVYQSGSPIALVQISKPSNIVAAEPTPRLTNGSAAEMAKSAQPAPSTVPPRGPDPGPAKRFVVPAQSIRYTTGSPMTPRRARYVAFTPERLLPQVLDSECSLPRKQPAGVDSTTGEQLQSPAICKRLWVTSDSWLQADVVEIEPVSLTDGCTPRKGQRLVSVV